MMLRLLRVLKILRVALRYGLDEIALSGAAVPPPCWASCRGPAATSTRAG